MPRIICTLENAGPVINGVKFTDDRGQKISEEVSDEIAASFDGIPGYQITKAGKSAAKSATPPAENS